MDLLFGSDDAGRVHLHVVCREGEAVPWRNGVHLSSEFDELALAIGDDVDGWSWVTLTSVSFTRADDPPDVHDLRHPTAPAGVRAEPGGPVTVQITTPDESTGGHVLLAVPVCGDSTPDATVSDAATAGDRERRFARISARTVVLDLLIDRVPILLAQGGDFMVRRTPAVEAFHEPVTVRLRRAGPALALVGIVGLFPASVVAVSSANYALAGAVGLVALVTAIAANVCSVLAVRRERKAVVEGARSWLN